MDDKLPLWFWLGNLLGLLLGPGLLIFGLCIGRQESIQSGLASTIILAIFYAFWATLD